MPSSLLVSCAMWTLENVLFQVNCDIKKGLRAVLPKRNIMQVTCVRASLVAQLVKNPPAMRETWVPSLGWEDPLEKGKGIHTSILV